MAVRISHKAEVLARQCRLASNAIGGEADWPATGPTAAELLTDSQELNVRSTEIIDLESQLSDKRKAIKPFIEKGREDMTGVDRTTDMLYGPDSGKKINFGLTPKKTKHEPLGQPEQVVIRSIEDGTQPESIYLDWETVEQAAYEVQWFLDAALTQTIGSTTVTRSELEIHGLEQGKQYWIRVRAVRASEEGKWSDPATRIANL